MNKALLESYVREIVISELHKKKGEEDLISKAVEARKAFLERQKKRPLLPPWLKKVFKYFAIAAVAAAGLYYAYKHKDKLVNMAQRWVFSGLRELYKKHFGHYPEEGADRSIVDIVKDMFDSSPTKRAKSAYDLFNKADKKMKEFKETKEKTKKAITDAPGKVWDWITGKSSSTPASGAPSASPAPSGTPSIPHGQNTPGI